MRKIMEIGALPDSIRVERSKRISHSRTGVVRTLMTA
jgi:hypothetical protein